MSRSALVALVVAGLMGANLVSHAAARTAQRCGSMNTAHGYANQIRVTGTSCATGRRVAHSYNACRARHHGGGACRAQRGYRCISRGRMSAPGQFYEHTQCTRGGRAVTFISSVNT